MGKNVDITTEHLRNAKRGENADLTTEGTENTEKNKNGEILMSASPSSLSAFDFLCAPLYSSVFSVLRFSYFVKEESYFAGCRRSFCMRQLINSPT
jgi:hypothetical protein